MTMVYVVVLMIMLAIAASTIVASAREDRSRSRTFVEEQTTWPHVQGAITGYRMALGARLATEADGFSLDADDMKRLAPVQGAARQGYISTGSDLPVEFRSVSGIWEHVDADTLRKTSTPLPVVAYHQPAAADPSVCTELGMPLTSCDQNLHGFWQTVRIELPDHTSLDSRGNVVVYLRAWLQAVDSSNHPTGRVARPVVVRAELRPGRFADFQMISDGIIHFGSGAIISGPVHSNGFDRSGSDVPTVPAIDSDGGVVCTSTGSLSTAKGDITVPGSVKCPKQANTNRYISFLRVFDELDRLREDAALPGAAPVVLPTRDTAGVPGREHAWQAWLEGDHVRFKSPTGETVTVPAGDGTTGVLVEDDVVLNGGDLDGRMTIAARRPGGGSANIYIDGDVNKNTLAPGRTLGLIAQGDIVIDMEGGTGKSPVTDCHVTTVRAALIAASGGVTIPPQYATDMTQPAPPQCSSALEIDGSIAAHAPPNLLWTWPDGTWAGYAKRDYRWDTRLLSSPPPYFPLTGTWQAVSVRNANVDCFAGTRSTDANCR